MTIWGWGAGERKDVLCNCPPPPLSYLLSKQTPVKGTRTHTRTHTKPRVHTHQPWKYKIRIWGKRGKKMASCVIHLGKQHKKNKIKHCALVYQSRACIHTHSQKYLLLYLPHLFGFFFCLFFSWIFFRQVQIFKFSFFFLRIHFFSNSFNFFWVFFFFYRNVKKKKNAKQEKYQQCLSFEKGFALW